MPEDYAWVTQEMFDNELRSILQDEDTELLLSIPGVYDLVREFYNNTVLTSLEEKRE